MNVKFHHITENKYTWPCYMFTKKEGCLRRLSKNIPLKTFTDLFEKIESYSKKPETRVYLHKEELIPAKQFILWNVNYQLNQDKSGTFLEKI